MKSSSLAASVAERVIGEGLPIAFLLLWWLTARSLPSFVLPGPIETGETLLQLFVDPAFMGHTLISLARVVASVILAVILGGALAGLARYVPSTAYAVQRRVLPVLNSFPSVGWAILATFWFQPDSASVIFVETLILIPFCAIALIQGIADMDRELLEMGASFSRSSLKIARKIALPMLLPYVMSSVRIAYGVGWKIALVSELFGAEHGLGYLMLRAEVIGNTAMVFASCFAIVIIFVAGEKLIIDPLARRFAVH
ncbi:MAG TPA: ABC transporter permease subunit [Stellaceae bacterium]|nr:ABC transporter permease subunit [Stellaceae bacterium]